MYIESNAFQRVQCSLLSPGQREAVHPGSDSGKEVLPGGSLRCWR